MIRVVLVDDQELVRAGLRRILHPDDGFDIVAECADGDEVEAAVGAHAPDLVVMDVRMKRVDGVEATRRLRATPGGPPILVLTTFDDDDVLAGALRAGASGFQLKDARGEDLVRAAHAVAAGDGWLDPGVTARVLTTYRSTPDVARDDGGASWEQLTAREVDVLRAIGQGATNQEIAEELFISETTVKSHVGHIFTKLGVRDRPAAIVFAYDNGIVSPRR